MKAEMLFSCRLDGWAATFGVFRLLWLAGNLAFVEVVLGLGTWMEEGYSLIFWLQAMLVFLPQGKVGCYNPGCQCHSNTSDIFHSLGDLWIPLPGVQRLRHTDLGASVQE